MNKTYMKKKNVLTVISVMMAATTVQADHYDYFIVKTIDGTEQSFTADGLTLTFSDNQLKAVNGAESADFALTSLSSMCFSTSPSGISETVGAPTRTLRLNGRTLMVSAPAGSRVTVATIGGMLVDHYTMGNASRTTALRPGIYIIRVNDQSTKINVR